MHVGECKYVYENYAFGDGSMRWDLPGTVPSVGKGTPTAEVLEWLQEGHRCLRSSVAGLTGDKQLLRPRRAAWGREPLLPA